MGRSHGQGDSEKGSLSSSNEDSFGIDEGIGLYVVCDGASNCAAGEVASRLAVEAVHQFIDGFEGVVKAGAVSDRLAAQAVQFAFDKIFYAAAESDAFRDMNTTLTLLLVGSHTAVVGHVGDSRLYLVRDERLHQITVDHDLTGSVQTNGGTSRNAVDRFTLLLQPLDVFLLCTDGLNDVLEDHRFVENLVRTLDLGEIVEALLDREHELNGTRDATAVVVRVDDEPSALRLTHVVAPDRRLVGQVAVAS